MAEYVLLVIFLFHILIFLIYVFTVHVCQLGASDWPLVNIFWNIKFKILLLNLFEDLMKCAFGQIPSLFSHQYFLLQNFEGPLQILFWSFLLDSWRSRSKELKLFTPKHNLDMPYFVIFPILLQIDSWRQMSFHICEIIFFEFLIEFLVSQVYMQ